MIVRPYRETPVAPTVALLTREGACVDEHGAARGWGELGAGVRVYGSWETIRALVRAGQGEALCWRGEETRWRHGRLDAEGWQPRPSDVHVLKLPLAEEIEPPMLLDSLARWRDWLAACGAVPASLGSTAWSLLRATLRRPLRTSSPFRFLPPLKQTIGGRQQLGPHGKGCYTGRVELLDLPAAYARTLGELPYGGHWRQASDFTRYAGRVYDREWWASSDRPCFARVRISVPDELVGLGPLPRRPRSRFDPYVALGLGCHYPVGRIQGVWTQQEIAAAEIAGCRVEKVLDVWAHFAGTERPFLPWWQAVERGRGMGSVPGLLAKMTGNALWGRFCLDPRLGRRTIRAREGGEVRIRPVPRSGSVPPAHDLAETVSGRVRAQLFTLMHERREALLSAHTDGAWFRGREVEPDGWRRKVAATRLDLLGPQTLRYTPSEGPREGVPVTVLSGLPASEAETAFDEAWTLFVGESLAAA